MPAPGRTLTRAVLRDHIAAHVFDVADDGEAVSAREQVGIELEWLTGRDGFQRLHEDETEALVAELGELPRGGRLTIEPGGQLEISSAPFPTLAQMCEAAATDLFRLDRACAARGIDLIGLGADPCRPPERILHRSRYDAMQRFFDHAGPSGRTMMCNTASIQINLGLGPVEQVAHRWTVANQLGPTLIAAFANSPFGSGGPSGWKSTRLQAWWGLDPSRSGPCPTTDDPVQDWFDYALAARVMGIGPPDDIRAITEPLSFAAWMADGHELGWPTLDDFTFHLTTLFPPVRPKGWFELRMIDALPTPFWHVAAAVTYALLRDDEARHDAAAAVAGAAGLWADAAQLGLGHPVLERAARRCFELALDALGRLDVDVATRDVVADYLDRWVARGRCPADDRHDAWLRDGTLLPPRESPVPYAFDVTRTRRP